MDYAALEVEIANRLNLYFNTTPLEPNTGNLSSLFTARAFPDNQEVLMQDYTKSLVNVLYTDSEYFDPESNSLINQRERVKVTLLMQTNTSAGPGGAYALIDAVKSALVGYKPTSATSRMWVFDYSTWQINGGQLMPSIEMVFDTVCQQVFDDSETIVGVPFSELLD